MFSSKKSAEKKSIVLNHRKDDLDKLIEKLISTNSVTSTASYLIDEIKALKLDYMSILTEIENDAIDLVIDQLSQVLSGDDTNFDKILRNYAAVVDLVGIAHKKSQELTSKKIKTENSDKLIKQLFDDKQISQEAYDKLLGINDKIKQRDMNEEYGNLPELPLFRTSKYNENYAPDNISKAKRKVCRSVQVLAEKGSQLFVKNGREFIINDFDINVKKLINNKREDKNVGMSSFDRMVLGFVDEVERHKAVLSLQTEGDNLLPDECHRHIEYIKKAYSACKDYLEKLNTAIEYGIPTSIKSGFE